MDPVDRVAFRSGFIALAGAPNVGKSSLLNALLRQNLMPVSAKPQTTRRRQLGILTLENAQLIFVDTPGFHRPQHLLGERMVQSALDALADADLVLAVFDIHRAPRPEDVQLAEQIRRDAAALPKLSALNKVDLVSAGEMPGHFQAYEGLLPGSTAIPVSALRGDNLDRLLERLVAALPEGPSYYPASEVTDAYERDIAADLIRAAAMELLRQEVPHSIAVRIDDFKERGEQGAFIRATLFVERESQKGIVIGAGGSMLREIGVLARQGIERMSGRKVYLELRVKVLPGWRNDERALKQLGYPTLRERGGPG